MRKLVYIGLASMFGGALIVNARTFHTGHLFVTLTDRETGGPITNATVTVRTQTEFNLGRTLESYFTKTKSLSDSNGIAHVVFQFCDPEFNWWVKAPSHYNGMFGPGHGNEHFGCVVEESDYLDIDTNTVQGLAMYNELAQLNRSNDFLGFAAKFNPKSVTYTNNVVCRSVCLTPKHNPRPMYAYSAHGGVPLPKRNPVAFTTNGLDVIRYEPVSFDMKECLAISTETNYNSFLHGPSGKVSDFCVDRFSVTTNGVVTTFGWICFAPGCGVYKRNTTGDPTFPMTYEADPNEAFVSRIPFEYSSISGRVVNVQAILRDGEYMVAKTRVATNELGEVTGCNYSKILGPMSVDGDLWFMAMIFNPTPNDPNLEFDQHSNLATGRRKCNVYP